MSIIRLSTIGTEMYAPKGDGTLVDGPFQASKNVGALGNFSRPPENATAQDKHLKSAALDRFFNTALSNSATKLNGNSPVVVMVHGFLFTPKETPVRNREDSNNPHCRVFHFEDLGKDAEIRHHHTGWPLKLGFAEDDNGGDGLAVAFGWYSQPGFAASLMERFQNFYARAYDYAQDTAWPLVVTLKSLADRLDDSRQIDIFCHSLGSSVVVRALALAAKYGPEDLLSRLGRVVILGGSEYTGEANIMYSRVMTLASSGGWTADMGPTFYNIVSRENDVLDKLAENFGPKSFFSDSQVIGHNGLQARKNADRWIDIQIDAGKVRQWGRSRSYDIVGDEPGTIWDHWYYYTWPGNMHFYSDLLRNRAATSLTKLRTGKDPLPEGVGVGPFGD
ncbi:MAG: hypothetical protein ACK6A4_12355 [Alphaproteobacteria bacterium]